MTKPTAKITARNRVYDGFFKLDELTIEADTHDGGRQTVKRLVLERGQAVAILGYDPKRDAVLMINEMRVGLLANNDGPYSDSLPAGMIDKGETALDAAQREALEETGAQLKNARVINPGAYVSAGGTTETIAIVYGEIDSSKIGGVHGKASEGESIKAFILPAQEFIKRANDGRHNDLKTLAAAFWLAANKDKLRQAARRPRAATRKTNGPA